MANDPRLYDILSHLSSGAPAKASELFKTILDERVSNNIREITRNTRITESPVTEDVNALGQPVVNTAVKSHSAEVSYQNSKDTGPNEQTKSFHERVLDHHQNGTALSPEDHANAGEYHHQMSNTPGVNKFDSEDHTKLGFYHDRMASQSDQASNGPNEDNDISEDLKDHGHGQISERDKNIGHHAHLSTTGNDSDYHKGGWGADGETIRQKILAHHEHGAALSPSEHNRAADFHERKAAKAESSEDKEAHNKLARYHSDLEQDQFNREAGFE